MRDFSDVFMNDWLMGAASLAIYPFYPAVIGQVWCIYRLIKGRYVPGWLLWGLILITYFPIALSAAMWIAEDIYSSHGLGTFLMIYGFGIGILVDFVSLPFLISGLRRRRTLGAASGYARASSGGIDA